MLTVAEAHFVRELRELFMAHGHHFGLSSGALLMMLVLSTCVLHVLQYLQQSITCWAPAADL